MKIRATAKTNAQKVVVARGLVALSPVHVVAEDFEGFDVELEVMAVPAVGDRAGHFEVRSVTVVSRPGGAPVSSTVLRSVRVAELARHAAAGQVLAVVSKRSEPVVLEPFWLDDETCARFRREGPTDEVLGWVARVYRLALVMQLPPVKRVEAEFDVPRATAGRWIALARDNGDLEPAEGPGKAGG